MPAATASTFTAGLAHREARRVAATLADPQCTAVHVVALPERMPLVEAAVEAAAEGAVTLSFSDVYVLDGGAEGWMAAGYHMWIDTPTMDQLYYPPGAGVYFVDTADAVVHSECHYIDQIHVYIGDFWDGSQLVNGGQALLNAVPNPATDVLIVEEEPAALAAEQLGYQHIRLWVWSAWDDEYAFPMEGGMCIMP